MKRLALTSLVVVGLLGCPATRATSGGAGTGGGGGGAATGGGTDGGGGGAATDAGFDAGSPCGDGQRTGDESCDDGNHSSGDGCSPRCGVEPGYFCPFPPPGQPSRCEPACGDGRLISLEPCDDGNARDGDGCSSACAVEPGYACTGAPSACAVTCGDGLRVGPEGCDDGNSSAGDGCSPTCQVEAGFVCVGTPSACRPICGDGVLASGEACDDGFADPCGSCNALCTGPGAGSSCGDGTRCPQTEQCDDHNTVSGDGCSATCTVDSVVDAGPPDSGAGTDAGTDAGSPVDAGPGNDAGASTQDAGAAKDGGPPGAGAFAYQRITNVTFVDDLTRVVWHPSGRFALLLGAPNRVIRYEPSTKALSLVQQLGTGVTDLDVAADGAFFLVAGQQSGVSHLWRIDVGSSDVLASAVDVAALPSGTVSAIAVQPGTSRFAAIARASTYGLNFLYLWSAAAGLGAAKGYNANGNALSLMWGAPALYGASANVLTADGVNGADSKTWVEASNLIVGNAWSADFGNPGAGAWQPGGSFGAFCGWSSNKLYVFDGSWHLTQLPGNTGISPQSLAFRADGQRALIVGRPVGAPLTGTVIEYRPTSPGAFGDASFVDVSIPGFGAAPYFGTSNQLLLDVAWRPGACDEGLIVGQDNGPAMSPTFGLAVRFYDTGQSACVP